MRYEVEMTLHKVKTVEVEAETAAQAVAVAEQLQDGYKVTAVDDNELMGRCEACVGPIFDGDDIRVSEDGCIFCLDCAKVLAEEAAA